MLDPVMFDGLRSFRAGVYGAVGARRDALFELPNAATIAGPVPSLAHLGLRRCIAGDGAVRTTFRRSERWTHRRCGGW